MDNPGIALCEGELGPDGVPSPGSGSTLEGFGVELSEPDAKGTLCGRLRFGIDNPGIALCEGELGPDGVPFPGSGS
ncbi:hypothetical protein T07_14604 [Trichinella nelsoni]|uniref:Uncharacterized protein n=1 Tax=Trichinella nelsoni TaxID=6336 RepID=A0A0V0SC96_9BILA|nr:hypothetical protein T07_14604 [Trichinella nelsoni]